MIRRPPRSTPSNSSAASDVYKRQVVDELNWLAAAVFRVCGALDVARVDFRLDVNDNWKPYILEINPLPGLSPGTSDLVIAANADRMSHEELVLTILQTAMQRYNLQE